MTTPPLLTLSGRRLPVVGPARIYVCGVTPYDVTHLGHAATFVWGDALVRVLRHIGISATVCRNVTDVDDVLFAAAERAGAHYDHMAAVGQYHFEHDMAGLRVRPPTYQPRARGHIDTVVALAGALLASGAGYAAGGGVYLPGEAVAAAAGLSRDAAAALLADHGGAADDPHRRDPLDQPVWQPAGAGEPAWPSPFGPGRPGWHAECAAMALSVLGHSVDIHVGGADLRFPHHAYEAAMAEAATGVTPFARAWLHAGEVTTGGAKMAKSAGNLVFVSDLLAAAGPAALRLLLLDRPWATAMEYRPADLDAAGARLADLHAAAGRPGDGGEAEVTAALLDDLDVPRAIDVALDSGGTAARALIGVLGLE